MKKIAFIGNLFHKKTLSSQFFAKILNKYFEVEFYYGLPRNNLKEIKFDEISSQKYDYIILWQVMPNINILNTYFDANQIIFIPMYDNVFNWNKQWNSYKVYKFINFSKTLHSLHKEFGIDSFYIQYGNMIENIKPKNIKKNKYRIFFWQRRDNITWNELKQLLIPDQIESIHIHKAVDPNINFIMPTYEEIDRFNITFSDWFETKEDYFTKIKESDIYISPRTYEGIGMSFIEAMSLGKCVIAPNFSTMNEYIESNKNGFLYDINNIKTIDLSNAYQLGNNAYLTIKKISEIWYEREKEIINFINKKQDINKESKLKSDDSLMNALNNLVKIKFSRNPIKKIKAYKNVLKEYYKIK
jgi:glycosyltransferase involved in cell wall biosynthesis